MNIKKWFIEYFDDKKETILFYFDTFNDDSFQGQLAHAIIYIAEKINGKLRKKIMQGRNNTYFRMSLKKRHKKQGMASAIEEKKYIEQNIRNVTSIYKNMKFKVKVGDFRNIYVVDFYVESTEYNEKDDTQSRLLQLLNIKNALGEKPVFRDAKILDDGRKQFKYNVSGIDVKEFRNKQHIFINELFKEELKREKSDKNYQLKLNIKIVGATLYVEERERFDGMIPFDMNKVKKGKIHIGDMLNGESVYLPFKDFKHELVGGSTGSGKSVAVSNQLASIFNSIEEVESIAFVDFKQNESYGVYRMLYEQLPDKFWNATNLEGLDEILTKVHEEYLRRHLVKDATGQTNFKPIFVFIDEVAEILDGEHSGNKEYKEIIQRIKTMLTVSVKLYRSVHIKVIVATQTPSVQVLPSSIRNNMVHSLLLKVKTREQAAMIIQPETYNEDLPDVNPSKLPKGEGVFDIGDKVAMIKVPYLEEIGTDDNGNPTGAIMKDILGQAAKKLGIYNWYEWDSIVKQRAGDALKGIEKPLEAYKPIKNTLPDENPSEDKKELIEAVLEENDEWVNSEPDPNDASDPRNYNF